MSGFAGKPPLGYRADGSPDPAEQRALRAIGVLLGRGLSLRRIARELALLHPARGRTWHLTTIARAARRLKALVPPLGRPEGAPERGDAS